MNRDKKQGKDAFPFKREIEKSFERLTGITDISVIESLRDVTGDTYYEMRKLTSLLLTAIECLMDSGKYAGYHNGEVLTEEQKNLAINGKHPEDLKILLKTTLESSWRDMLNKQQIGINKLGVSLRDHLEVKPDDENN